MTQRQGTWIDSRHQTGHDSLEKEGQHSQETTQVCAESGAKGKHASRQSAGTEEQGDQGKGEHASRHKIVVAGPDECGWNVGARAKVPGRIEWESRRHVTRCVVAAGSIDNIPERPS